MTRTISLLFIITMAVSFMVSGVFAMWQYSHIPPDAAEDSFDSNLDVFDFPPEEIVPDDDVSTSLGENHFTLIETIVYEDDYGLNATKKPIIHSYLKDPGDIIYCSQNVQGGNLKHLMVDQATGSNRLYFVITKISDTEYHAFTMRYSDITDNPIGTEIEAYKTVILKTDGKWSAYTSYYGCAKVNDPGVVSRGIDITSWRLINQ